MLPQSPSRAAQRSQSSLEPLEARIAPASVQPFFEGAATVDLALTKTADVSTAAPGDTITYTFHASNGGTADATGVTVTDPVMAGLNFVATENLQWSLNQAHTAYLYNYGSLGAGAQGTDFTLKLHVSPTVPADLTTVTNSATISDDLTHGADANPNNNTGSAPVTINADATLHIALRSESAEIAHGAKAVFTLIYSNTGNRDAHVVLTEHPANNSTTQLFDNPGWTYNAASNVYEYDAGTLAARSGNHSVQYVVQANASIPTSITQLTDVASIDYAPGAAEPGTVTDDKQATVSTPIYQGIYVLSPGTTTAGHYGPPRIEVFDISTATKTEILVYPKVVRDSIRTSLGDFNGDGFDDIVVTTEHGLGATEVFDGATGKLMASPFNGLQPFGKNKGSFVAVGDLSSSVGFRLFGASPEVVFGSALGGGAVKIYSPDIQTTFAQTLTAPTGGLTSTTFYPFGKSFTGGVRVAIGDIDHDGRNDLVVAEGNFGGKVAVYSGGDPTKPLVAFTVGGAHYRGGLNLAVGDIDSDGTADIVTGRNRLSAPTVEIYGYQAPSGTAPAAEVLKATFNAFSSTYKNGVRVALADVNHDDILDIIATTGYAGKSQVKIFDGSLYHTQTSMGNITLIGSSLLGDDLTGLVPGEPIYFPTFVPPPAMVITAVPPLLKSFTAFPGNLSQAVWASATVIVPSVPFTISVINDGPFV